MGAPLRVLECAPHRETGAIPCPPAAPPAVAGSFTFQLSANHRISVCHCLECQRRTGAVISNQARFRREQITFGGKSTAWMRTAESGNVLTFHFCPTCGSTVYWEGQGFPGYVAVAVGTFADQNFPAPTIAVWEESRHLWVTLPPGTPLKRMPKQG